MEQAAGVTILNKYSRVPEDIGAGCPKLVIGQARPNLPRFSLTPQQGSKSQKDLRLFSKAENHTGLDSVGEYATQVREINGSKSQHLLANRNTYKEHFLTLNRNLGKPGSDKVAAVSR